MSRLPSLQLVVGPPLAMMSLQAATRPPKERDLGRPAPSHRVLPQLVFHPAAEARRCTAEPPRVGVEQAVPRVCIVEKENDVAALGSNPEKVKCVHKTANRKPLDPARNKGGRPRRFTPELFEKLIVLLRQGKSRNEAARELKVSPSTIHRECRLRPDFEYAVGLANDVGQQFRRTFERLFVPSRVVLEDRPVIDYNPEFEMEKQGLIATGLSREWISRMRLATPAEREQWLETLKIMSQPVPSKRTERVLKEAYKLQCTKEITRERFSNGTCQGYTVVTTRYLEPGERSPLDDLPRPNLCGEKAA